MTEKVYIGVNRGGFENGIQIAIGVETEDGGEHGFRIAGPKYCGNSQTLKKHYLNANDAAEIRRYLDRVAP
jgi:hypothetical protein